MTVKELIEKLRECPPGLEVHASDAWPITYVGIEESYDRALNEILKVVKLG